MSVGSVVIHRSRSLTAPPTTKKFFSQRSGERKVVCLRRVCRREKWSMMVLNVFKKLKYGGVYYELNREVIFYVLREEYHR